MSQNYSFENAEKCRVCLIKADPFKMVPISVKDKTNELEIYIMIQMCAQISINTADNLPGKICENCLPELLNAFAFRKKCQNADKSLRCIAKSNEKECNKFEGIKNYNDTEQIFIKEEYLEYPSSVDTIQAEPEIIDKPQKRRLRRRTKNSEENDSIESVESPVPKRRRRRRRSDIPTHEEYLPKTILENLNGEETHSQSEVKVEYKCDICSRVVANKYYYRNHIETHKKDYNYLCNICGKRMKTWRMYDVHMLLHDPDRCVTCEYCGKLFTVKSQLELHLRTHTGERPFQCDICDFRFAQKSSLTTHMRTHTGERPFKCTDCDRTFRTTSLRTRHHKIAHSKERPHKCHFCSKAFPTREGYRDHMRKYSDVKNFKCEFCDKAFNKPYPLKIHRRIHTGERPHNCTICEKSFNQRGSLMSHIATQHKNIEGNIETIIEFKTH